MANYNHKKIEKKWQGYWKKNKSYKTCENGDRKCYVLDMFPYPSGDGLHVGHPKGYIATDVYSRMKKMQGYDILHPMGWDAFGLPAENYAIKNKIHPEIAVKKNIKRFKEQLSKIGFNYDWDREINTTDPAYYRWTQWIFLKLFEKGLAYESNEPINWCPSCQTGLANEDVEDGKCERCGTVVEKKPIRQWVLKITDYADKLLEGLPALNWPESIKESQRNWIGKSEGAEISFNVQSSNLKVEEKIKVFTTRPDTLFGATYLVLAPEHPFLADLGVSLPSEVRDYIEGAKKKTEIERTSESKEKTGVELKGIKAINPATKEEIPVWVADYVLADYGTGAIMAVPAHDERDFQFAQKYLLPTRVVVREHQETYVLFVTRGIISDWKTKLEGYKWKMREDWAVEVYISDDQIEKFLPIAQTFLKEGPYYASTHGNTRFIIYKDKIFDIYTSGENLKAKSYGRNLKIPENELDWSEATVGDGQLCNSGKFDGINGEEAKKKITEFVGGKLVTKYKLRDWVFSRQRYWGEPIPLIHCEKCALSNPAGRGVVPVPEEELPVKLPKVKSYAPTGTGESPLASISKWVNTKCPVCKGPAKRETNTMPQWAGSSWYHIAYAVKKAKSLELKAKSSSDHWLPVDMYVGGAEHATRHLIYARFWHKFLKDIGVVSTDEPFTRLQHVGLILASDGRKMSKRFGNVINPDDIVATYGADTLRVYEMFMGPFSQNVVWSTESIIGSRRFLERIWKLINKIPKNSKKEYKNITDDEALKILLNESVQKISEDIETMRFNTAISKLMILSNAFEERTEISKSAFEILIKLLHPFAPHITEELWSVLANKKDLYGEAWPVYDETMASNKLITIGVQVNGKVRGSIEVSPDTSEAEALQKALSFSEISKWVNGDNIIKVIYVNSKILNIVAKNKGS